MDKILETERLYFRNFVPEDLEDYSKLASDPEVMKYISDGKTRNDNEIKGDLERIISYNQKNKDFGLWAAILKESNKFIGWFCLKPLAKTEEIEVGYRLLRECWGKGYASEGAIAFVKYGFEKLHLERIVAVTDPENKASIRVLEKTGLKFEKFARYYNAEIAYFSLEKKKKQTTEIREYRPFMELQWLDVHAAVMVDSAAWWTVLHKKPVYENEVVDLVALVEGKIAGFIVIEIDSEIIADHNPAGFVWEFGVHRDFRGNKIGEMLIEKAHKIMNSKFKINKSIWYSQDEFAQKFYEKSGMKEIGRHWQFSITAGKEIFRELLKDGFNCWNMRGSSEIKDFQKAKKNFEIIENDETLKPRICVGYEFNL